MTCSGVWKLFSNGLTPLSRIGAARQLRVWPRMHRRPRSSSSPCSSSPCSSSARSHPYRPLLQAQKWSTVSSSSPVMRRLASPIPWPRLFLRRRVCHAPLAAAQRSMGQQSMFTDTDRICRAWAFRHGLGGLCGANNYVGRQERRNLRRWPVASRVVSS